MTKKVGEQTPLPRIQSPECSVKEEIPKTFWPQIWHDLKKLVPRPSPSPKNWNSRVLYKGKNSENFLTSHLAWPKKVGVQTHPPPQKISESRAFGKGKNSKKFLVSYLAWPKKSWYLDIQSRVLSKGKNSEKLLTSNLAWPKKSWCLFDTPLQIQSPECLVKEKILKIYWPQVWNDQKKVGAWTPLPLIDSESRVVCKGKNSKKFLVSNLAWP